MKTERRLSSRRATVLALATLATATGGLAGCSETEDQPKGSGDAVTDAASVAADAASAIVDAAGGGEAGSVVGAEAGASPTLAGTVKDRAGVVVAGAKIEVGAASVFSDTRGTYTLPGLAAGPATVKVTRDWFKPAEASVSLAASAVTPLDLTLDEIPLKVEQADLDLAASYAKTFDWTKQTISVAVVREPTRREFDNAFYLRNPALYKERSGEAPLSPTPAPEISGGGAKNFAFPLRAGRNMGQEAFDLATIADSIKDTPLGPTEPTAFMMWTPMINWLTEWDPEKSNDLKALGVSVRQQTWGGSASRPQEIEKVFIDKTGALWGEVVFAPFAKLGIQDDDGDMRKEIYARIAAAHYSAEIVAKLANEYGKTRFYTHGLSKELGTSLREIYSTNSAQIEKMIGQPFELPNVGTFLYPFVVLKYSGGQKNVLLVAPGP